MKQIVLILVLIAFVIDAYAADNQIYITQTSANNTEIDIEQLGSGNIVGDNATATNATTVSNPMNITGANFTLNLDQIGNTNKFLTDINGTDGNYNLIFTGDSNNFIGQFNSAGTYSMTTMDLDTIVAGGSNSFTINVAQGANADDSVINWDFDGDNNTVIFNAATAYTASNLATQLGSSGAMAAAVSDDLQIEWDIDGSNNTLNSTINSKYVQQDWDITGSNNTIDYAGINNSGATSDSTGHYSDINVIQNNGTTSTTC